MSPNILVAVPCLDMVCADFAFSLARLTGRGTPTMTVLDVRSSDVAWSRNEAVRQALDGEYSHLMFLDSDMHFPADTLTRLLGHGKPIVGATYVRRCEPYSLLGAFEKPAETGLVEALELPAGCLLINVAVLRKISWPWFKWEYGDEVGARLGEDLYFCRKAREAGLRVYCDMDLSKALGHVGVRRYTIKDGIEFVARERWHVGK